MGKPSHETSMSGLIFEGDMPLRVNNHATPRLWVNEVALLVVQLSSTVLLLMGVIFMVAEI